jgi:hypothetical protein
MGHRRREYETMTYLILVAFLSLAGCRMDPAAARQKLASTDRAERAKAAEVLSSAYTKDPAALGDHGEEYWAERLKRVPGKNDAELSKILPGAKLLPGSEGGGGGRTVSFRLDTFWVAAMGQSDRGDALYFRADPPRRVVVHIDVQPPPAFTGTWTTYYVNGAVYESAELDRGHATRARLFHDNGQVREDNVYEDGRRDGHLVTYFADGKPEWDQTYARGELVGEERWYWQNGKLREERHWKNGIQDGRTKIYAEGGSLRHCIEYRDGVAVGQSCGDGDE